MVFWIVWLEVIGHVFVESLHRFVVVIVGSGFQGFTTCGRIVLQELDSVWGIEVDMSAADGEYRMHQTLVPVSEMEDDVLEGILGFSLHSEDVAEAIDVMPPEYLVLHGLDSMKEGL